MLRLGSRFWFGSDSVPGQTRSTRSVLGAVRVDSVGPSQLGRAWSTQRVNPVNPVDSVNLAFRDKDSEYCRMHASKSSLGNDIMKSYIASFAQEYSVYFSETMARLG
ncbi:hypothetical protein HanPI659440_Chr08g0311591 [Helianthus annuus]|nr:hypothetical protein HanPI659440_Chr08g0311591 [Helianthus annuus]